LLSPVNPCLYSPDSPAADHARRRDDAFFASHPRHLCRVRPLIEGESALVDELRERHPEWRAYCIVIEHGRAGDRRATAGRGIYPVILCNRSREEVRRYLAREAVRFQRWFRRSAASPPPRRGACIVM
jgi:hypothetical protein